MPAWFRLPLIAVLAILARPAAADPPPLPAGIDPSIGKVEVTLDLPKDKPYVGEMIMLRMRSFIRADVVLDAIVQPPLTNFDWQQLGRDKPISAMVDGFQVAGFERDLAIFPQQAGRLIIGPFIRRVTIVKDDMSRVPVDFASKPIFVDVQNANAVSGGDEWWLPAKSLQLTDVWSVPPDEIAPGTLSRRTITLTAVGLTADRLPPPPKMLAPGTIAFKGPAQRETLITEDGPVARATYVWDIRPVSASPARLPAITIPWYDTSERRSRTVAIPDTWVAYVGTLVHPSHEKAKTFREIWLAPAPLAAGGAAFVWTAACAAVVLTRRRPRRDRGTRRALADLARRGRYGDARGLRLALEALARAEPARYAAVAGDAALAPRLRAFDAAQYARQGGAMPDLNPLARDFVRRWRAETTVAEIPSTSALPPLDGPAPGEATERPSDRVRR